MLTDCVRITQSDYHLLYIARFCAGTIPKNSQQKHKTKNFGRFPNHFPLLTMIIISTEFYGFID